MRSLARTTLIATALLLSALGAAPGGGASVTIDAGKHARGDTPVSATLSADHLGSVVCKALEAGPIGLRLVDVEGSGSQVVQAELAGQGSDAREVVLSWVVPGPIAVGAKGGYRLDTVSPIAAPSPWRIVSVKQGEELRHGDRPVLQYNTKPVKSMAYGPIQHRDAYIHPVYSPSGALITGDFSPFHPHHRGFFLAYAKAQVGESTLDFWNIHTSKGKIRHESLERKTVGPVLATISTHHVWDDKLGKPVLRERWDITAIEIPGASYWLFDLTSTQVAVDKPFELLPYRYGGMSYRGAEPFVKGPLDVLNSEGKHRVDGNLQPTRWVDLTGPIASGSPVYAGAFVADHPGNLHHPTVARIHPTTLPFFSYVPASSEKIVMEPKKPLVFRYRVLIHDGHPDGGLDERVWRDFAEPPKVSISFD